MIAPCDYAPGSAEASTVAIVTQAAEEREGRAADKRLGADVDVGTKDTSEGRYKHIRQRG